MFPRHHHRAIALYLSLTVAFLLLGALLLLRPAAMRAQSQPEALGSVSGTVRNAQGEPLPNITVSLEHYTNQYGAKTVQSDSEGRYHFVSVLSGLYRLRFADTEEIYAPQYYRNSYFAEDADTITVNGNHVSGVNMTLNAGGAILLTVQSADGVTTTYHTSTLYRQSASGRWATYRVSATPIITGSERIANLPSGNYRLCLQIYNPSSYFPAIECYDNLIPERYDQLAPNARDIKVQAGATTEVTVIVNDIAQLEGYMLAPNNQPIAGVRVELAGLNGAPSHSIFTNEDGYFRFGYIHNGLYFLSFNAGFNRYNSYLPLFYPNELLPVNLPDIIIDSTTRMSLTRKLTPEARITGKVTLSSGAIPLDFVNITVYQQMEDGAWNIPFCDSYCAPAFDPATGNYTATQLLAGRYRVGATVSLPGSQTLLTGFYGGDSLENANDIVVTTGETKTNIDITVGENEFDSAIAGVVTANGQPQQGIEVGVFSTNYDPEGVTLPLVSTVTDAQGRYTLAGLSTGYYPVGFRDPQGIYATTFYTRPGIGAIINGVFITTTGTLDNINMALVSGGTIRGHVRRQNGANASDFVIQILPETISYDPYLPFVPLAYFDVKTDASGAFAITGLLPRTYYVRAKSPANDSEFPTPVIRYHGESSTQINALPITVKAGETVSGKDIFFFFEPTNFMPIIGGPPPDPFATLTPTPPSVIEEPAPVPGPTPTPRPIPTSTPAIP